MKKISLILLFLPFTHALLAQTYKDNSANELNLNKSGNNEEGIASVGPNGNPTTTDDNNCEWLEEQYGNQTGNISYSYLSAEGNENDYNNISTSLYNRNSVSASANYNTGLGFRFGGWDSGLTIKHFIKSNAAIEGILSFGWNRYSGTRITGLYEVQKPISGAAGLSWFYGGGAHISFYQYDNWDDDCKNGYYERNGRLYRCDETRTSIGIDGIIGLEYHFKEIPFTIGLDWKPSFNLIGWGSHVDDGAFSVRYAF